MPNLYQKLNEQVFDSTANIIEVNDHQKLRILFYQDQKLNWSLDPSSGLAVPIKFSSNELTSGVWTASNQFSHFFIFGSNGQISKNQFDETDTNLVISNLSKLCFVEDYKVVVMKDCDRPVEWQVKKAFVWNSNFIVITSDLVYTFDQNVFTMPASIINVTYDQFIIVAVILVIIICGLATFCCLMRPSHSKLDQSSTKKAHHSHHSKTKNSKGSVSHHHRHSTSKTKHHRDPSKTKHNHHGKPSSSKAHGPKRSATNGSVVTASKILGANNTIVKRKASIVGDRLMAKPSKVGKQRQSKVKLAQKSKSVLSKIATSCHSKNK